jgi:hypothetical protein
MIAWPEIGRSALNEVAVLQFDEHSVIRTSNRKTLARDGRIERKRSVKGASTEMLESKRRVWVRRVPHPGKFIVMIVNPEFPHLVPNDGEMSESELATCLAEKYGCSQPEIESLINEANVNPALETSTKS